MTFETSRLHQLPPVDAEEQTSTRTRQFLTVNYSDTGSRFNGSLQLTVLAN